MKIPKLEEEISNLAFRKMVKTIIDKQLINRAGRKLVYKEIMGTNLSDIPYADEYRNPLAHDIGKGQVVNGFLRIVDLKGKEHSENVQVIISRLKGYVFDLK